MRRPKFRTTPVSCASGFPSLSFRRSWAHGGGVYPGVGRWYVRGRGALWCARAVVCYPAAVLCKRRIPSERAVVQRVCKTATCVFLLCLSLPLYCGGLAWPWFGVSVDAYCWPVVLFVSLGRRRRVSPRLNLTGWFLLSGLQARLHDYKQENVGYSTVRIACCVGGPLCLRAVDPS